MLITRIINYRVQIAQLIKRVSSQMKNWKTLLFKIALLVVIAIVITTG